MGGGPSKRYRVERDIDTYNEKQRGRVLRVVNESGNDVVVAVYKVHSVGCLSGECPINQTVRQSPRVFIAAGDTKPVELHYKPLGFSERFLPGVKLFLYWSYPPTVKPGESKPSLVRLALALRSAAKKKPVSQKEILGIANEYWPTVRDYYIDPSQGGATGFVANQVRPLVQGSINDVLLPDKLETVDKAVLFELQKNRQDYRNTRVAEPNGITKIPVFGKTTDTTIPPIKTTKFLNYKREYLDKRSGGTSTTLYPGLHRYHNHGYHHHFISPPQMRPGLYHRYQHGASYRPYRWPYRPHQQHMQHRVGGRAAVIARHVGLPRIDYVDGWNGASVATRGWR